MEQDAIVLLEDLDRLFDTPDKWTKGAFAREADGRAVTTINTRATCWCFMGGLERVCFERYHDRVVANVLYKIGATIGLNSIPGWNDRATTTFEDVKAVIHGAIKTLKGKSDEEPAP